MANQPTPAMTMILQRMTTALAPSVLAGIHPTVASTVAALCRDVNRRRKRPRNVDDALLAFVKRLGDAEAADMALLFDGHVDAVIDSCRAAVQRDQDAQIASALRSMPKERLLAFGPGPARDAEIAVRERLERLMALHVERARQQGEDASSRFTVHDTFLARIVVPDDPIPRSRPVTAAANVEAFSAFARGRWRRPDSRCWFDEVSAANFTCKALTGKLAPARIGCIEAILGLPWSVETPYGLDGLREWVDAISKMWRIAGPDQRDRIATKAKGLVRDFVEREAVKPIARRAWTTRVVVDIWERPRLARWSDADEAIQDALKMIRVHEDGMGIEGIVKGAMVARILSALSSIEDASELSHLTVYHLKDHQWPEPVRIALASLPSFTLDSA